jgi:hypothetical protein
LTLREKRKETILAEFIQKDFLQRKEERQEKLMDGKSEKPSREQDY